MSCQKASNHRRDRLPRGFLNVEELDAATAEAAGWIKHTYWMSLGDTFAAATVLKHGADLCTGDPELLCSDRIWSAVDLLAPQDRTPSTPYRRTRDPQQTACVKPGEVQATGCRARHPAAPRLRCGLPYQQVPC